VRLSDLSEKAQKRVMSALRPESRVQTQELAQRVSEGRESAFQRDAERWLEFRGWWRRSPRDIEAGDPPMGWQLHFPKAKGNPLILDLILLRRDGQWIEIELKTATGRLARHQRQLVDRQENAYLCRSLDELRHVVETWCAPVLEDWQ